MSSTPLASAVVALVAAFGVGALAIAVGGIAIFATLGGEDRASALQALRHPLRTVFDHAQPEDDDPEDDDDPA